VNNNREIETEKAQKEMRKKNPVPIVSEEIISNIP
jgi:hypothetical protein